MKQVLFFGYCLGTTLFFPFFLVALAFNTALYPDRLRAHIQKLSLALPKRTSYGKKRVLIHAVSLGEVISCAPLIGLLQKNGADVCLSTGTEAGYRTARERYGGVEIFFFPFDFFFLTSRFLEKTDPDLILLCEMEIWPAFIRSAYRRHIPLYLISGRLPNKDFLRYLHFRWFFKYVFSMFNGMFMQTEEYARRMKELCNHPNIKALGSLKFDVSQDSTPSPIKALLPEGFYICAASTHKGDEEPIVMAFQSLVSLFPALRLIIAPRHPNRSREIRRYLHGQGIMSTLRSDNIRCDTPIFIIDTVGELAGVYQMCDLVIIGGSFSKDVGGHNIVEPAKHRRCIVCGKHMENFGDIYERFKHERALVTTNEETLFDDLKDLMTDRERMLLTGSRGYEIVEKHKGASGRVFKELHFEQIEARGPSGKTRPMRGSSVHKEKASFLRKIAFIMEAVTVIPLGTLLSFLPLRAGHALASPLGRIAFSLNRKGRSYARHNLDIVFSERPLSSAEKDRIIERLFKNIASSVFEYLKIGGLTRDNYRQFVRIENLEAFQRAFNEERGFLAISGHIDNWEYLGSTCAKLGQDVAAVIHRQINPYTDRWLMNIREKKGKMKCYYDDETSRLRRVVSHLKKGGRLALLADERESNNPVLVPFFGRRCATPNGPAKLHLRYGLPLFLLFSIRQHDGKHLLSCEGPYHFRRSNNLKKDCERVMSFINRKYEEVIKKHPDQWFSLLTPRWERNRPEDFENR